MKYLAVISIFSILIACYACTPAPPPEAEVRAQLIGIYCASDYKLQIEDSTYYNQWTTPSPLGKTYSESCSGKYSLEIQENSWIVKFHPDSSPKTVLNTDCSREDVVWTPEKGYLLGGQQDTIRDLFGKAALLKSRCTEI